MKTIDKLDIESKKYIIFDLDGTLIDSIGIWNITDYKLIKNIVENLLIYLRFSSLEMTF